MAKTVVFIDSEINPADERVTDLGAVRENGTGFHSPKVPALREFIGQADFVCGHNIVRHDLRYLSPLFDPPLTAGAIDTLYLSPLLFPNRPYHRLLKDDKLQSDELNNPLNDAQKARELFYDEISAFEALPKNTRRIFCCLLYGFPEFRGFFDYVGISPFRTFGPVQTRYNLPRMISETYAGRICENAPVEEFINKYPVELAYALALIGTQDYHCVTPPWLVMNYPQIDNIVKALCHTPCGDGCAYCRDRLDVRKNLRRFFGYDSFRTYAGEPLQERAARAAVEGKSLLAVFPTGGGKSLTFQLPALMAGECAHGLTVVISPLQSLMKDQVDNLTKMGIVDAVTVNGLLSPVERAEALERVESGMATILYISPEQLRSRTIEKLLLARNVVRFVIDEAHCFSAWGQDFRVDYLYIGDFIREYMQKKELPEPVPVSCFTATAKQKVITDICDYFRVKLDVPLELFTTSADRENLRYTVLFKENDNDKYVALRDLIAQKRCPTIVYVSRTKRAVQLAQKLTGDGLEARAFHGQMEPREKTENQEAFIENRVQVIVATSAFGMGVDKKDVRLVIHYDISDSLENYVQEAGRAGRDPGLQAECYVLFNNNDLDKHFILLNQTKLSIGEIQQVWSAVKQMTHEKPWVCCSALEIARQAGWDDSVRDVETRVKTAVAALESAGYVRRGKNVPHVYATSILADSMADASAKIDRSGLFNDRQREQSKRIIKSLISTRSLARAGNDDAESRVDYLADMLAIPKAEVIECVNLMRQDGLLADSMDMSAYIFKNDTENRSSLILNRFARLEEFLLGRIAEGQTGTLSLKEINSEAQNAGIKDASVKNLRTLLYYMTIKGYIAKPSAPADPGADDDTPPDNTRTVAVPTCGSAELREKFRRRIEICRFILSQLYESAEKENARGVAPVVFSLVDLYRKYNAEGQTRLGGEETSLADVEDALLYLSKIGAMRLEGGFLVLYNGMEVRRLVFNNRISYKAEDYRSLNEYYKQKIQQIHIVGEYANLMVRDADAALQFVRDYFSMDFNRFIAKYFKGERAAEINRNITPQKYQKLFGELSDRQREIINDASSRCIVVAAGPGSGKTRVLVHKLASLMILEDVKHEQLLMLTFSRAAATEFRTRLQELIGNAVRFTDIKTFHSYCFDLLGKTGSLDDAENVVETAAKAIADREVEPGKITKRVLVIDEAQDMSAKEFALVRALMDANEGMRVIAVGDDDQNIFGFRGSSSEYLKSLITDYGATRYELLDNYRSSPNIVALANRFALDMPHRMKENPILPVQTENGIVRIVHHTGENIEQPIVSEIEREYRGGTCAVLTGTNDEALRVVGLLQQRGIPARLIQSLDGFRLSDLAEVRFFLRTIDKGIYGPKISDALWMQAKAELRRVYGNSACVDAVETMADTFEQTCSYERYRTDLTEFIRESDISDFCTSECGTVFVSTVHKAKGREFDSVWLLLGKNCDGSEDDRRRVYVGLTRAGKNLFVHCACAGYFDFAVPDVLQYTDGVCYPAPPLLTLCLTFRDVVLDFFRGKKQFILHLRSGMPLEVHGNAFYYKQQDGTSRCAALLSNACRQRFAALAAQGYEPDCARVSYILAWHAKDDGQETAVLLPEVRFKKREDGRT